MLIGLSLAYNDDEDTADEESKLLLSEGKQRHREKRQLDQVTNPRRQRSEIVLIELWDNGARMRREGYGTMARGHERTKRFSSEVSSRSASGTAKSLFELSCTTLRSTRNEGIQEHGSAYIEFGEALEGGHGGRQRLDAVVRELHKGGRGEATRKRQRQRCKTAHIQSRQPGELAQLFRNNINLLLGELWAMREEKRRGNRTVPGGSEGDAPRGRSWWWGSR